MMSSSMAVKKLLVLGGTGFVGSRFMNLGPLSSPVCTGINGYYSNDI
jgi:hypothetical protein